ncbi:MAG: hypothetical protein FWH29_10095 [Methanobrevibacter sp.]|nr:hypothetical protein [Methanobrevibacter sp.]
MAIISIEDNLFKKVEKIAKNEGISENKLINDAIELLVDEKEKNTKKIGFWDLGGKYKAGEPFSAVEDIKKMRNGEL